MFASLTQRKARIPFSGLLVGASPSRLRPRLLARSGALVVLAAAAPAQQFERVSVDSAGAQGNGSSVAGVLSADGWTSAFSSWASNLVAGDTNGLRDVFVRDAATHATVRVSISSTGLQANGASYSPSLSGNGRFLAFTSEASNLVPGDTNGVADVFVHDRDPDGNGVFDEGNGLTERVSVDSSGLEAHGASYGAYSHTISDDGSLVVFRSNASDLVAGDGNGASDIFVHDRISGTTRRVSVDSSGVEANLGSSFATISGNGAIVAFQSDATNLVPGDTNGVTDVFTHDLLGGLTTRASVDSSGLQFGSACSTPALSSDGGVIAFRKLQHSAGAFSLWVRDSATGSSQQITGGSYSWGESWFWTYQRWSSWTTALGVPAVSADGSKVAYVTSDGSTYFYDQDWVGPYFSAEVTASLWVFDRSTQATCATATYTSWNFSSEGQALSWTGFYAPAWSGDVRKLAFESDSPDLVAGDTNGLRDAFVCNPDTTPPVLSCPQSLFVRDRGSPGEIVTFSIPATDCLDPAPTVVCVPPSGSFFPRGKTLVTCTATDASGNESTCEFEVTVQVAPVLRR